MSVLKGNKNIEVIGNKIENNTNVAQEILDGGDKTCAICADYEYTDRIGKDIENTYKLKVESDQEFQRFADMKQRIDFDRHYKEEYSHIKYFSIDFNEWKSGKMDNGAKVGKTLLKNKYPQVLVDFYSAQNKNVEERELYFTVSGASQIVAGMTYYSDGSWSSCQRPSEGGNYPMSLAGSLADDKLYVGFIHDELDIDGSGNEYFMIARTVMRLVEVDGIECLVATHYYGNNTGISLLNSSLEQLECYNIYSKDYIGKGESISQNSCADVTINTTHDIEIDEEWSDYVDVDCPACGGNGTMERDVSDDYGCNYVEFECPACCGDGTVETEVTVCVDEWIEVESEERFTPYAEGYDHEGDRVYMNIDTDRIIAGRVKADSDSDNSDSDSDSVVGNVIGNVTDNAIESTIDYDRLDSVLACGHR